MTGRERLQAALSAGGTPEIPAVICYEGIFVRDHWAEFTRHPWWYRFSPDLDHQIAWRKDFWKQVPQDWFVTDACPPAREREDCTVEERSDGVYRVNRKTGAVKRLQRPQVSGWDWRSEATSAPPNPPNTPEEIDARIPLIEASAEAADGIGDLAARLSRDCPDRWPFMHVASPLWLCYHVWGFEGMMTRVAESPELVRHAAQRVLERQKWNVRRAGALGAAGIWIEECFTDLIGPRVFDEMNVPLVRALTDEARACGLKSIYYYCGNPWSRMEALISCGADALALEEGKKGFDIDIEQVAAVVRGRCALLGNLDAMRLLEHGAEDDLRRDIARQIAAGRRNGSRFVMSIGSPVTPGTTVDRVRLYLELAHEMGG